MQIQCFVHYERNKTGQPILLLENNQPHGVCVIWLDIKQSYITTPK